jgi:hypothetical protein
MQRTKPNANKSTILEPLSTHFNFYYLVSKLMIRLYTRQYTGVRSPIFSHLTKRSSSRSARKKINVVWIYFINIIFARIHKAESFWRSCLLLNVLRYSSSFPEPRFLVSYWQNVVLSWARSIYSNYSHVNSLRSTLVVSSRRKTATYTQDNTSTE